MNVSKRLVFALCLFCGMSASAHAQPKPIEARGELLYSTHCNACHTSEIHWRKQKLATDWNSLKVQVRRWQANIGLGWGEEEITDVAYYLNALHYGFPSTDQKNLLQSKNPNRITREY